MVDYHSDKIDSIFHALSDATRRAILAQLASRQCTVSELAEPHDQTLAGISKHLKVLEAADLVRKEKQGRIITCSPNLAPIADICAVLESLGGFWRERLEALEKFLTNPTEHTEVNDGRSNSKKGTSKGNRGKGRAR